MKEKSQRSKPSEDNGGVRETRSPGGEHFRKWAFTIVGATLALAVFLLVRSFDEPRAERPDGAPVAAVENEAVAIPSQDGAERDALVVRRAVVPERATDSKPRETLKPAADADVRRPAEIDARDYIAALREAGETEGLAAFPPPGTRPPRTGIVVPDDYQLPEGYMRHYQTTDDGRRLEPILTLAPDYELVDAAGNPLPLGEDRIVPPEGAPDDLPIRVLEIPPARATGAGAR